MSRGGPNLERRKALDRAVAKAKKDDELDLPTLAKIWGTSKQTFVNTLRVIEAEFDPPEYRTGDRGTHIYPAKAMLEAMLRYEKRNDSITKQRHERAARILGQHRVTSEVHMSIPINDLATLSRIANETELREREQRLYIHRDEVSRVAGAAFGAVSSYLSQLEAHIDPNGVLTKDVRAVLREGGTSLALRIHKELTDMLAQDAEPHPSKPGRGRRANGRSGGASSRRPGARGSSRKAR